MINDDNFSNKILNKICNHIFALAVIFQDVPPDIGYFDTFLGALGGLGAKFGEIRVEKLKLRELLHSGRYYSEIFRKHTFWCQLPVSTKIFPWRHTQGEDI